MLGAAVSASASPEASADRGKTRLARRLIGGSGMSPIILLGAYRSPPPLASDLEIPPCTAPHRDAAGDARCRALPPHPPRFPAQIEAPSDPARAGERGGPHFMAFFGSPLAASARRGLLAAGMLLCGALVGSSVTVGAIGARLAALRSHHDGVTHPTPKTPPTQLPSPSAAPAFPMDQTPQAPNIPQHPPLPADDDAKRVSPRSLPLTLSTLGAPTHDPRELVRRAERLIGEGAPISLLRSAVSLEAVVDDSSEEPRRVQIVPLKSPTRLLILKVNQDSFLDAAGLARGDRVIAVNGYLPNRPEDALTAYESARKAGRAVAEIERHGELVVLDVTWTSPPRPPSRR